MAVYPRLVGTHHHYADNVIGPGFGGPSAPVLGGVAYLTNSDAGTLAYGDVVVIDTAANSSVKKVSTNGDPNVIGVVADTGPYAIGALTPVLLFGYHAAVKVSGATARGDYLKGSGTSGKADPSGTAVTGVFGRALTTDVAGVVVAEVYEPAVGTGSGSGSSDPTYEEQTFDASGETDGAVTTFTMPDFFVSGSTKVWRNGLMQRPIVDYDENATSDSIVMTSAPAASDELIVVYLAQAA